MAEWWEDKELETPPPYVPPAAPAYKANGKHPPPEPAPSAQTLWIDELGADEPDLPRDWIAKPFLLRGNVTSLFGHTSLGKSTLALAWGILLALPPTKLPHGGWGGFVSPGSRRVLVYGLEEDRAEQRRRIKAILRQFGASIEDLGGRLRVVGASGVGTLLELDRDGGLVETACMEELRGQVAAFCPDVLMADPMAELHSVEENSNSLQRLVVSTIRAMARDAEMAVLLVAHSPKGPVEPGSIASLRGAGAIGAAIRIGYTVCAMCTEDAQNFGVTFEQANWFFRLDKAKGNYSAPARNAQWFQRETIIVGTEDVGSCRPWEPPVDLTPSDEVLSDLLERVAAGDNGVPWTPTIGQYQRSISKAMEAAGISSRKGQELALQALLTAGCAECRFKRQNRAWGIGLRTPSGKPEAQWEVLCK